VSRAWPANPSTAGRPWPFPDLRNGTTVNLITDLHMGKRSFIADWATKMSDDLYRLRASLSGSVQAGDAIDWFNNPTTPEDALYVAWRDAHKTKLGLPLAECVGNHDLASHATGGPTRNVQQWAAAVGVPSQNTVVSMGGVKVITVGPDSWGFNGVGGPDQSVLSAATLTWLDQQLTAAGSTPCWIAAHSPLYEQFPAYSDGWLQAPKAELDALIGSHSNVIGWLSGHLHTDIQATPEHAGVITVGGRKIFAVNGPPSGGRLSSIEFNDHQWLAPDGSGSGINQSMFVTYLGGAIDVRWRNHNGRRWAKAQGAQMRHILLTA